MSIIELGALGEFLGSIGVIATPIYLAMQIRQNTRSLDEGQRLAVANAYQARSNDFERIQLFLAGNEELSELHMRVNELAFASDDEKRAFLDALPVGQRARLRAYWRANVARIDNLYFQKRNGFVDERFWEHHLPAVHQQSQWWELERIDYGHPDFRGELGLPIRDERFLS